MMEFEKELAVAKNAARKATRVMERYQEKGFDVERKRSYNDLVTEADREAQRAIIDTIEAEFPEDGFLAEEDDVRPDGEDRVWVIDPIDGTTNFVHGFPNYCTSIALQVAGDVKVAVVSWPSRDMVFTAVVGEGAFRDGERLSVSTERDPRDAIVIGSLFLNSNLSIQEDLFAMREQLAELGVSFRRPGAAVPSLCHLAAGNVESVIFPVTNPWDIAAGRLLVTEAGGSFRETASQVDGYLAAMGSNGSIDSELEEVFDRHVGG